MSKRVNQWPQRCSSNRSKHTVYTYIHTYILTHIYTYIHTYVLSVVIEITGLLSFFEDDSCDAVECKAWDRAAEAVVKLPLTDDMSKWVSE